MKILKAIVKAILIFSIICSALFVFLYFILGDFPEAQEKRMRNRLLKCKDVVDVVVRNPLGADEIKAAVDIYITNGRSLRFSCVHYDMNNKSMHFWKIQNESPLICVFHKDILTFDSFNMKDVTYFFPKIKTVQNVIDNYDMLYEVISNLYELSDDVSDWESIDSDYTYYDKETQSYRKLCKMQHKEND